MIRIGNRRSFAKFQYRVTSCSPQVKCGCGRLLDGKREAQQRRRDDGPDSTGLAVVLDLHLELTCLPLVVNGEPRAFHARYTTRLAFAMLALSTVALRPK